MLYIRHESRKRLGTEIGEGKLDSETLGVAIRPMRKRIKPEKERIFFPETRNNKSGTVWVNVHIYVSSRVVTSWW